MRTRFLLLILLILTAGCSQTDTPTNNQTGSESAGGDAPAEVNLTPVVVQLGTAVPDYNSTPTPDAPHHALPTSGGENVHIVSVGDTLGTIAQQYGITVAELLALNPLDNPDIVPLGQALRLPGDAPPPLVGPSLKLIPDSELVYGPTAREFDVRAFVTPLGGYLTSYSELVERQQLDGPAIVELIASRYSIHPRLLLAVLEHQSGWLTLASPANVDYPLGYEEPNAAGLYWQLYWAANLLNLGYYGRGEGGLTQLQLADGTFVSYAPDINDGTAGVQNFLGAPAGTDFDLWQWAVGPDGFAATYARLFGNPFGYAVEPLLPDGLSQPPLALPWQSGETWYFTSGPHGGWNSGSAWAALDFAPPGEQLGCFQSDLWVTSMSDGVVVRSDFGAVVVDTDGDAFAGTGWAYTYMHLEPRDRVAVGTAVKTGDRLGHPACEGGFSNGTHLHVARTYNGRWISADGAIPFNLSGWVAEGLGSEYDGLLVRDGEVREAWVGREALNAITAD